MDAAYPVDTEKTIQTDSCTGPSPKASSPKSATGLSRSATFSTLSLPLYVQQDCSNARQHALSPNSLSVASTSDDGQDYQQLKLGVSVWKRFCVAAPIIRVTTPRLQLMLTYDSCPTPGLPFVHTDEDYDHVKDYCVALEWTTRDRTHLEHGITLADVGSLAVGSEMTISFEEGTWPRNFHICWGGDVIRVTYHPSRSSPASMELQR